MKEKKTPSVLRFPKAGQNAEFEQNPQADVTVRERKIWNWLVQHAQLWVRIACTVVVIGGVVVVFHWMNDRKVQKCLRDYQSKATLAERVTWAESASLPSGVENIRGLIFLQQANESMKAKEYEKALRYYQKAKAHLKLQPLCDEAAVGCGFAALHINDLEAAEKEFHPLCKSTSKYIHSQALYGLCYVAGKRGNAQNFSHYKTQLLGYDPSAGLATQIEVLFPEMGK